MTTTFLGTVCVVVGLQAVAVAQNTWTQVATTGPQARFSHAMACDSQRGRTVLFGGRGNSGAYLGDTWEWNGTTWLPQVFASGPVARFGHAMAYDSQRGRTVLFGGYYYSNGSTYLGDTWEWDGITWAQVATTGPPARYFHAMAYDSQRGRSVMFGGASNGGTHWDTWEWNGSTWTQVANGPGRRGHAMAFDSQSGRTVLFGSDSSTSNDTWEWNGTTWTQVGTTWPVARATPAMAYNSQRGRIVLFGGGGSSGAHLGDTWEWNGSAWTQVITTGPARIYHAMVYDSQRGRMVMFGGVDNVGVLGDTWEWNGGFSSTATTYGNGCGNPALSCSSVANAPPTINTTAQASLANIPGALAFVALGWSRAAVGAFPLPLTLTGFGMPGCDMLQSCQEIALPTTSSGPTTATYSLPLPNWSGLIGLHLYLQGWAVAPGVNPGGLIVSNGLDWLIGL